MKTFWTALAIGCVAIAAHVFVLNHSKEWAYQIAPPPPVAPEISDETAIGWLKDGKYGVVYEQGVSRESIQYAKDSIQGMQTDIFYMNNVAPIEADLRQKIRWTFSIVYFFLALLLIIHAPRWPIRWKPSALVKSGKRAALNAAMLVSRPFNYFASKGQIRRAEADFLSLRTLHENGLISEEDFNIKKQELRNQIKRGL